jgi:mannitol-specific phosphotransferase system IIBC component
MGFLIGLVPAFVPERFRKAAAIAAIVLAGLAAFFLAKHLYDRSVIKAHDNEQAARVAKADKKADNKAADERRVDDARVADEKQEIKDAIEGAKATGGDGRAAYYHCVELQQRARRERKPSPDC